MSKSVLSWMSGRTAIGLAALLSVAACGGGGGGTSSSDTTTNTTVAVSGIASKGLLANAKVTAYGVKSDGTADTASVLGSAITDANGAYTISGLAPSVPVVLVVTPLPAEGSRPATTMKDESTGSTVTVDVSSGFSLSAVTVLDSSGTTSAQITPFTNMAAKLAQTQAGSATGGVTIADVIKAANNSISTALNIPILTEVPTFSGATPTNAAAVKLAAVAVLAHTDTTCNAASTDLDKIKCAVDKLKDEVPTTPPTPGTALLGNTLVTALNTAQDTAASNAGITNVAEVSTGITTAPVAASAQVTAIARAKSLLQNIRNVFNGLQDKTNATSLASRAKVVGDAIDATQGPVNMSALGAAVKVLEGMIPANTGPLLASAWDPLSSADDSNPVPGAVGGGCKVFASDAFTSGTDGDMRAATYVGCRVTYALDFSSATATGGGAYTGVRAIQHILQVTKDGVGGNHQNATQSGDVEQYTIKTLLVRQTGAYNPSTGFSYTGSDPKINLVTGVAPVSGDWKTLVATRTSRGPDAFDSSFQAYSNQVFNGDLAPSLKQYRWGVLNSKSVGYSQVVNMNTESVTVDAGARVTRLNLSGGFVLKSTTNETLSSATLKTGSYVQATTEVAGYINNASTPAGHAYLDLEAQASNGAIVAGTLEAQDFVDIGYPGTVAALPGRVTFTGSIKESASATTPLFSGSIAYTQTHSETNTLPPTNMSYFDTRHIVLNGTLVTTGSNTLTLSALTFNVNGQGEGTCSGTYTQTGGDSVYVEMSLDAVISPASYWNVTSSSAGISIRVRGTESGFPSSASILNGDTLVGLIDFNRAKVTYADNTYEQY